jgi:hypothetical protein
MLGIVVQNFYRQERFSTEIILYNIEKRQKICGVYENDFACISHTWQFIFGGRISGYLLWSISYWYLKDLFPPSSPTTALVGKIIRIPSRLIGDIPISPEWKPLAAKLRFHLRFWFDVIKLWNRQRAKATASQFACGTEQCYFDSFCKGIHS